MDFEGLVISELRLWLVHNELNIVYSICTVGRSTLVIYSK